MKYVNVDNKKYDLKDVPLDTPILWVLRDYFNLTGTKFGCGVAMCGACTVLLDGKAIRSCQTQVSEAVGKNITTIQDEEDKQITTLRKFWKEEDVAQCGYCQPGQIMNAAGLLKSNAKPTQEEIEKSMHGNICRCGTYNRIKSAIFKASKEI